MPFVDITRRERKTLVEGVVTRTFWGENMLLGVVELDANAVIPAHAHPNEQSTIVLQGELEMDIEGEKRWLKPGDIAIIPGNARHGVIVGPQMCLVVDVFSPAREDMKY